MLCGCENWILNKSIENMLEIWEQKILRKIYGGKKENETWRRRTNKEIIELYKQPTINTKSKIQRQMARSYMDSQKEE